MSKPKAWDNNITYLTAPLYSKSLSSEQLQTIKSNEPPPDSLPYHSPCPLVHIKQIADPLHPACGQRGLFASKKLEPGSFVLPYFGYVHSNEEADDTSNYDLSLDRDLGVGVDAQSMGNEARFVNDYRGVPGVTGPNVEFRDVWVRERKGTVKCIGVFVLPAGKSGKRAAGVKKGEEILVSYGKGFWKSRDEEPGG